MDQKTTMNLEIKSLEELKGVARKLMEFAGDRKCFLLYGEIGAGKTTLVKAICSMLGVEQAAKSPTFSLVNEYIYKREKETKSIYHIDLYRLESLEEALDIGIEEYLYSGAFCFIEWPELIETIVEEDCVKVFIEITEDSLRKFIFL